MSTTRTDHGTAPNGSDVVTTIPNRDQSASMKDGVAQLVQGVAVAATDAAVLNAFNDHRDAH